MGADQEFGGEAVWAVKIAEAMVDLGKRTSIFKTYRFLEMKGFTGILTSFATL